MELQTIPIIFAQHKLIFEAVKQEPDNLRINLISCFIFCLKLRKIVNNPVVSKIKLPDSERVSIVVVNSSVCRLSAMSDKIDKLTILRIFKDVKRCLFF